jgi:hypothetical protein
MYQEAMRTAIFAFSLPFSGDEAWSCPDGIGTIMKWLYTRLNSLSFFFYLDGLGPLACSH